MDLDLTPEQDLLRETVRGLCGRHAGLDVVRQLEDDPVGYPEKLWLQLGELGLLDVAELTPVDLAIVYEELGRALAPSPHLVSSVVSAGVIRRAGSDEQQAAWLPRMATGEVIVTPAWLEPRGGFGERGVTVTLDDRGRVAGTKRHVQFAKAADRLLVLARDTKGDVRYVLVDPTDARVTLTQQQSVASDPQYRVDFDGVAAETLAGPGWAVFDDVMHEATVALAAQAAGGARHAL